MPSTVPHFGHMVPSIRDKGDPREESKRAERKRPENRGTNTKSPGNI